VPEVPLAMHPGIALSRSREGLALAEARQRTPGPRSTLAARNQVPLEAALGRVTARPRAGAGGVPGVSGASIMDGYAIAGWRLQRLERCGSWWVRRPRWAPSSAIDSIG